MAKITAESREQFEKESSCYREDIKKIFAEEKERLDAIAKDNTDVAYKKIELAELMIFAVTKYLVINELSWAILDVKNEDSLNEGRKTLYKAVIYLEEVVTNFIDCAPVDIEDKLAEISNLDIDKRYYIVRKLGLAIRLIIDAYGDNTKWKWAFVELQGRFATVAKNMLDITQACKDMFDGRSEKHDVSAYYIRLLEKLISKSADGYRDRYELSTKRADDMRLGINYLLAYRRILLVTGKKEEAEEVKKKAQVWKEKMEADAKKQKKA